MVKKHIYINLFISLLCWAIFSWVWSFGKNKVQYENLLWQYKKLPHFHSYFHQGQGELPAITGQWIENAYTEVFKDFNFKHKKPIPILVYGSPTLFEQTNVTPGIIPEGVGGFTESLKNRIVVPFTGSYEEFRHVLHHELVHAFQFGILFDQFGGSFIRASGAQLPLWFAEGSAEYLSSGWNCESDMFLMDRAIFGSIPLPGLGMDGYMVYKGGQSFLFFLASSRGDSTFTKFLTAFKKSKKVVESLEKVYKKRLIDLGKEWQRELKRIYWPEMGKRENVEKKGVALTSREKSRSYFNLHPRISPDGSMVAYYSDAKDYTKIFITDLQGEIQLKIGQFGSSGFFESFQPFRSGFCWSPQSDQLAFISKNNGKNEIRIINVKTKKLQQNLTPDFASLSTPDWSPDGKKIVFCGLRNHQLDIYMMNITDKSITQLTNDIRSESSPRFSRDGSGIVFAARDTSGIANRNKTHTRPSSDLFFLNLNDKSISQLTSTPWNEKHPCFSPDGNHLAFISDQNGINNIYLAPFNDLDSLKPLTNIIGGCATPDWSIENNSLVFSLFRNSGWDVWRIDEPLKKTLESPLAPTLWVQSLADTTIDFFTPAPVPVDSTDTTDTIKDQAKLTPKFKIGKRADREEEIGIVDGGVIFKPDSTTIDSTNSTAATSSPDESEDISQDSLFTEDSTSQIAMAENSTDSLTSDQDSDSAYQTPQLPKDLTNYPYKPKFSVDIVSLGMAYNTLYGYAGQGILVFSDLLGNHQIAMSGNIQGSLKENNIFVAYLNSQYRLDYGIGAFYDRYFTYRAFDADSLYHDTNIGGFFLLRYPFSLFSRLDLNFFYEHMRRVPSNAKQETIDSLPVSNINITLPSLSFVFDNIIWGITGPVNGTRANASLLFSPAFTEEDASFISFDVDLRKYIHINRKFVWANRFTFGFSEPLGRHDSERKYFLGGNENWIFYDINVDSYEKNISKTIYSSYIVPFRGWNYFDITGIRYAVFNTEFRFPFVRSIDLVWPFPIKINYITGAFFIDMGNAWDPEDQFDNFPLPRKIYGGLGFGLRANLGIFILRYDLAWKTDWHTYIQNPQTYFSLGADF